MVLRERSPDLVVLQQTEAGTSAGGYAGVGACVGAYESLGGGTEGGQPTCWGCETPGNGC